VKNWNENSLDSLRMARSKLGNIPVVSFFAGCGGMDLGFEGGFDYLGNHYDKLSFDIVVAYDNDPKCVDTYRSNVSEKIELVDLASLSASRMPAADVLMGGFPCQDFSSCGPKNGLTTERGRLYQAMVRYMRKHQPKVVVAENVPHLARMHKGSIIQTILVDLESSGYRFKVWTLHAPDYGVPQKRTRLFLVGVRNDLPDDPLVPKPDHVYSPRPIEWAIGDLVIVNDERIPNQTQYFKASKAKRGNGQGDEVNKKGYPSYTIRANAKSRVQFHYSLNRRLTVRECARLQTFPDSFVFPHSATTNVFQIGNAVPPVLAYKVARSVEEYLIRLGSV
jgi:DNA (cytosine-5)-methyltransferase 1